MAKHKLPQAILIHGWDPKYYNKNIQSPIKENIAWSHRPELIKLLAKRFNLEYFNLPGFCGIREPKDKFFDVEDFADYFAKWKKTKAPNPQVIIAYSFGGPVAITYKVKYHDPTPLVLISPALIRAETLKSKVAGLTKTVVPNSLTGYLKDLYQKMASQYYRQGTPFLRSSYDVIVRQDMSDLLNEAYPANTFLIYGDKDEVTPWSLIRDKVIKYNYKYHLVAGGRHNIGQTHPEEIVKVIGDFLTQKYH